MLSLYSYIFKICCKLLLATLLNTIHARCAGLSGVYNITEHYEHEKTRAVEYISAMHKAMGGVENFEYYSPTARFRKLKKEQLERCSNHIPCCFSFHLNFVGWCVRLTVEEVQTRSSQSKIRSHGFPPV